MVLGGLFILCAAGTSDAGTAEISAMMVQLLTGIAFMAIGKAGLIAKHFADSRLQRRARIKPLYRR